jgi:hypothetical protein
MNAIWRTSIVWRTAYVEYAPIDSLTREFAGREENFDSAPVNM